MSPQQRLIANARLRQDRAQAAMDFIRAERAKLAELPSSWVVEQKTHRLITRMNNAIEARNQAQDERLYLENLR